MATPAKEQAVQDLEERFQEAQALVFTDFRGLNANQMVELRQKLRAQNLEYRVVKNRLAQRAAESAGLSFDGILEGPTAICFGYDDPIQAFKQSVTLTKEFPNYEIKGGLSAGEFVDAEGVKELAELPSHEELLTQLAGAFQGPVRKLTMSLNDLLRQMVSVLDQVAEAKPASDAESAEDGPEATATTETADPDTTAEAASDEATAESDDEPAEAEASVTDTEAGVDDEAETHDDETHDDSDEDSDDKKGETS